MIAFTTNIEKEMSIFAQLNKVNGLSDMGIDKNANKLAASVVKGMQEIKAHDIIVLDLHKLENTYCQSFVICHGDSNTHVNAIANSVAKFVKEEMDDKAWSKEGLDNCEWVLLDYGNVIVHVFQKTQRDFYNIEDLWADADKKVIETALTEVSGNSENDVI